MPLRSIKQLWAEGAKALTFGGTGGTFDQGQGFIQARLTQPAEGDFRAKVGDLWGANVVLSCLKWQATQLTQARPVVYRPDAEGALAQVPDHPALGWRQTQETPDAQRLAGMRWPNAYMDWPRLLSGVLLSLAVDGNAYLWRERANSGRVIGWHYLPHWTVEPVPSGDVARPLLRYDYDAGDGRKVAREPAEIIHLAEGVNPRNRLKGLGRLSSVWKEVYSDEEAAACAAYLLQNMGIPGAILTAPLGPNGQQVKLAQGFEDAMRRKYQAMTSGKARGGVVILDLPWNVHQAGFNPQQLLMDKLRDIPEERVTAAMGIPAVVVGFGAGLSGASSSQERSAMEAWAWRNNIQPLARLIDEQVTHQAMGDYLTQGAQEGDEFGRDYTGVAALAENENETFDRLVKAAGGPILTPNEARALRGLDPVEGGDALRGAPAPDAVNGGGQKQRPFVYP